MSPELFYPDPSGLKDTRPTKQSDCYALGMVIYEVLSGQVPFTPFHYLIVIRKVIEGERPGRPDGPEGTHFTNDLWQMLNSCWETQPQFRPSAVDVLECLEQVSSTWVIPSQQADENVGTDVGKLGGAGASSRILSWFDIHHFIVFLYGALYLQQLQAMARKIFASRGGGRELGRPQPTIPTQDRS